MVTTQKKKAAPNKYIYKFNFLKNIFFSFAKLKSVLLDLDF